MKRKRVFGNRPSRLRELRDATSRPNAWVILSVGVGLMLPLYLTVRNDGAPEPPARAPLVAQLSKKQLSAPEYSAHQLAPAVDRLMALSRTDSESEKLPLFARQQLGWLFRELDNGSIRVVLQGDVANANRRRVQLMGPGMVEGRRSVVVAKPVFVDLLAESSPPGGVFSEEQRNDFMLALVHESVRLRDAAVATSPAGVSREVTLGEELRAWREVDLNGVRPMRAAGGPMHSTLLRIDDEFRACGEVLTCRLSSITVP